MKKLNDPVNPGDFENQLRCQPLRELPAAWRAEILAAAKAASNTQHATRNTSTSNPYHRLSAFLSALLWPCPQAWAGLAAVWLVILLVNYSPAETHHTMAQKTVRPSPEVTMALKEQQRLLAKLIEPLDEPLAEPPKPFVPRPRTECNPTITLV